MAKAGKKKLDDLSRSDLIEMIHKLEKNQQELENDLEKTKGRLDPRGARSYSQPLQDQRPQQLHQEQNSKKSSNGYPRYQDSANQAGNVQPATANPRANASGRMGASSRSNSSQNMRQSYAAPNQANRANQTRTSSSNSIPIPGNLDQFADKLQSKYPEEMLQKFENEELKRRQEQERIDRYQRNADRARAASNSINIAAGNSVNLRNNSINFEANQGMAMPVNNSVPLQNNNSMPLPSNNSMPLSANNSMPLPSDSVSFVSSNSINYGNPREAYRYSQSQPFSQIEASSIRLPEQNARPSRYDVDAGGRVRGGREHVDDAIIDSISFDDPPLMEMPDSSEMSRSKKNKKNRNINAKEDQDFDMMFREAFESKSRNLNRY